MLFVFDMVISGKDLRCLKASRIGTYNNQIFQVMKAKPKTEPAEIVSNLQYTLYGKRVPLTSADWAIVLVSVVIKYKDYLQYIPFFRPCLNCLDVVRPRGGRLPVEGCTVSIKGSIPIGKREKYLPIAFVGVKKITKGESRGHEIERYIVVALGDKDNTEIVWRMIERQVNPFSLDSDCAKNYQIQALRPHQVRTLLKRGNSAIGGVQLFSSIITRSVEDLNKATKRLEYVASDLDSLWKRSPY